MDRWTAAAKDELAAVVVRITADHQRDMSRAAAKIRADADKLASSIENRSLGFRA